LNEHEQKYVTHDLELVAIVHMLKMWRHYLLGRRFFRMTDHYGLKYLFNQPRLNAKQARWMALMSEFDFEIKHIKGKENNVRCTQSKCTDSTLSNCNVGESDIKKGIKTED
jgi:hypothetical protein